MAPQPKGQKYNANVNWAKYVYGNYMREVAQRQEELKVLDEKVKFIRGEALHHQTQLMSDFQDGPTRIYGPRGGKLVLTQKNVERQKNRKAAQDMISVSEMSNLVVTVEGIERPDETAEEEQGIGSEIPAGAVVKQFKVEGKAGNIAYTTNFSAYYNRQHEGGKITKVDDLKCSSKAAIVQQVTRPQRLLVPRALNDITSYLYFLQMLEDEREEVTSQLEDEVPNLMVERGLEPMIIIFNHTRGRELKIHWTIIWDAKNERLKYDISVVCSDEVAASYRRYKEIYPYLSGQDQLRSSQDVADFIDAFE